MATGTKSPQYVAVQKNWTTLAANLATGTAHGALLREFRSKPWIGSTARPDADGLIEVVLDRIKNGVDNYAVFITMLKDIPEMEDSVKKILGMCPLSTSEDSGSGTTAADGTLGSDGSGGTPQVDMMCFTDWMTLTDDDGEGDELWYRSKKHLWKKKKLKVHFINRVLTCYKKDGDPVTKRDILDIANEWHNCGKDVVPEFVRYEEGDSSSDIRVQFIENGNPRSKVGTIAEKFGGKPTMWLNLTEDLYKRTIRHEFGHALGMRHEHQHEGAPPLYDEQKLRDYLTEEMFGPDPPKNEAEKEGRKKEVDEKIRKQWMKISRDPTSRSGKYDKNSVMHYLIPREVRVDGYGGPTVLPVELSESDKKYIVEFYSGVGQGGASVGGSDEDIKPDTHGGSIAADDGGDATIATRTKKLDIDKDTLVVKSLLKNLENGELRDLFRDLGLFDSTVHSSIQKSRDDYADDLIRKWILEKDDVLKKYEGGATWDNLKKALTNMNHHGIANKI